jgi:hypothetical protein
MVFISFQKKKINSALIPKCFRISVLFLLS